jgi:hypothetical protein
MVSTTSLYNKNNNHRRICLMNDICTLRTVLEHNLEYHPEKDRPDRGRQAGYLPGVYTKNPFHGKRPLGSGVEKG